MEYSKLVAVTGLPGLYELISSKNDGAVVRSLDDNSTKFASSRIHNFSHLESIEVYTTGDNVNLAEIFFAIEKAGVAVPDTKDNGIVKKFFEKVYPELDFERVYPSDLKKMVKWFEVLKKHNIEIKLPEPVKEEEPEEVVIKEEPKEKPKKKEKAEKPAPKEVAKKETKSRPEKADEKKPAKKTAKKKEETKEEKTKKKTAKKKK
ncbi:MAG: DUF5606 domain-containing protein [Bacteroidota bacterium]|nr:DUF5606 domain-containing protein [Bacteroidota bacterium]